MNTKKNYKYYQEVFERWDKRRTPLELRRLLRYTPKEDEIFRPCYLPESSKGEPFYKARHALPKYWFVSNYGTMITVENDIPELFVNIVTDEDKIESTFDYDGWTYQIGNDALVALVFNDESYIEETAKEIIEENGIKAFTKNMVTLLYKLYIEPLELMNVVEIVKANLENLKPSNLIIAKEEEPYEI